MSPQDSAEGQTVPVGHTTTARALWVRCPVDEQLHLLGARAVLQLAALGCALACCSPSRTWFRAEWGHRA
ncbi:MAG: hypothetical protein JO115_21940 [Pseudonocardiales bacterium]|nr:hypothetical protein [Pseudonocardiales bacterium]